MKITDKDLVVRSAVFLASLLVSTSERIKDDVAKEARKSHMFSHRNKPLPDSVKRLFEYEFPSRYNGGQNAQKLFRRVRRSLTTDIKPEAVVLQAYSVDVKRSVPQYEGVPKIPQRPTAPVSNLQHSHLSDSSVVLSWGAPNSHGTALPVPGYRVYEQTGSGPRVLLVTTDKHNYTVTSLLSGTRYLFTVKPYNQAGEGPSAVTEVTTSGETAPQNVKATPYNNTAIQLTWEPPRYSWRGDLTYYIYYGPLPSGVNSHPVGHTSRKMFVVGNLRQDIVYVFEVSACSTGKHSDPVNSKTKFDADDEPVHSLKAVLTRSSTIVLTWEKPVGVSSDDIKNYVIKQSFKNPSGDPTMVTKHTTGKETTYTFKYLYFNTSYSFDVMTRLFKGDRLGKGVTVVKTTGPFSASVGPLQKKIQDNTVILSWSAPRTIDLDKDLENYNISWTCSGCYSHRSGTKVSLKDTTAIVSNLKRDQTYGFYVYANTIFGRGEISNTTVTISRFFGQVQNLRQSFKNYTLTLQWEKPSDVEAKDIKRYFISWCDTTKYRYCYTLNSTNVTGTQFKTPLFAGDTYTFYVRGITAYGEGKESSIQVNVPSLDLQVRYLTARSFGRYGLQVYLSWYDWSIPSGLDVLYEVRWHCIRGRGYCYWNDYYGWSERTVNTTTYTVDMQRYNMAYVFEVLVLTPQGRGKPSQLYYAVPEFNGMPTQFICKVTTPSSAFIVCHWVPPTDVNPLGFYHYDLKYRCDDCLYNPTRYKSIDDLNQTSVNITTVNRGATYTVWIQVHTRYGTGKWAQTTAVTPSPMGPVTMLMAEADDKIQTLVHLSWQPPTNIDSSTILYYVIITVCPRCGNFDPIRTVVNTTSFNQTLSCGQTYVFTVTAVTKLEVSAASQVTLALKPVSVEPVSNLTVKYFPGYLDGSGFIPDKDWIKSVDRFLLTWDPPKTLAAASIQGYEIAVFLANKTKVYNTITNATSLIIKCDDFEQGQIYVFESRVKALCGVGAAAFAFGYYPHEAFPSHYTPLRSSVVIDNSPSITVTSSLSSYPVMLSTIARQTIASPTSTARPSPSKSSVANSLPTKSSSVKPSATKQSPANSSPTTTPSPTTSSSTIKMSSTPQSPTKPSSTNLFSPLALKNNEGKRFPYWAIPTAILGVILIMIVVVFIHKSYRRRRSRQNLEQHMHLQDTVTKDTAEGDEMPLLLESFPDDEILVTA